MELVYQNIHMENCKAEGNMQTALEEDINLPENKEDVDKILLQKGKVKIDEIKVSSSHAFVKGKILYSILYKTLGEKEPLQSISGSLPFFEDIYVNGLENGDHVSAEGDLEDISVHIINSRKLNLRALLLLHVISEEMLEEKIGTGLEDNYGINCQKQEFQMVEIVEQKRDIFRIRDEVELAKSMPNIANIIWKDTRLQNLSYKPLEDKIYLKGELIIFILYHPDAYHQDDMDATNKENVIWYETRLPFQGELSCQGSREGMLLDIQASLGNETIDVKQDMDQENRMLGIDCAIDLTIHLYEPKSIEYVSDAYGVCKEVTCTNQNLSARNLLLQKSENVILEEELPVELEEDELKQLCFGNCAIHLEDGFQNHEEYTDENEKMPTTVQGYFTVEVLYQSKDVNENTIFKAARADYPFSFPVELTQDDRKYQIHMLPVLQEFSVNPKGKDTFTIRANILINVKVFFEEEISLVSDITVSSLDCDKMKDMPGMLIYFVEKGDTLWQIGKKYYMDVEKIKELNHLKDDTIKKGDKLLLIKEFHYAES